jgi:NADP-dependent 3-hydroxy acid dehydrogenase YdfG
MPKIFFITGAGSGIGRVTARYLLERGHRVFLTDYNSAFLDETCTKHLPSALSSEFQSNFKRALMNTTNQTQVIEAVTNCVQEFGTIDILVNSTEPCLVFDFY